MTHPNSPVSSGSSGSPASSGDDWLYARVHHAGNSDGERLLCSFVPAWRDAALRAGATGWFFIRYADAGGPHLRVRFRGTPEVLDDVFAVGRDLWSRTADVPVPAGGPRRLHPEADSWMAVGGHRRLGFGVYGREHHYYGAPAAVRVAEQVFDRGSDFALRAVAATAADPALAHPHRAVLARDAMDRCLDLLLDAARQERFRALHTAYWSGRAPDGPPDPRLLGLAADCAAALGAGPDADVRAAARGLGEDMAAGVRRALDADPSANASRLLLMQVHMTFNRLGLLPLEEAVAALMTRCPQGAPRPAPARGR
ncbi:lantibiotic dehydratase C-terminal domain-containing protein [Streptomyces sp. NPDC001941]|uniref:lantibiotic dehydratase C-terminal domain-containing protein n=1 Tax=Streptomyces sp. NPDC001941 TaxID=3154659 RepID=UPI003332E6C6